MVIVMKTTTILKVFAICLVFVFTMGPPAAAAGVSGKAAIISGYQGSSGYSQIVPSAFAGMVKPDLDRYIDTRAEPSPKTDWTAGEVCNTCAVRNASKTWQSVMMGDFRSVMKEKYGKDLSGYYFGGGAGGGGAGGGGCCG